MVFLMHEFDDHHISALAIFIATNHDFIALSISLDLVIIPNHIYLPRSSLRSMAQRELYEIMWKHDNSVPFWD